MAERATTKQRPYLIRAMHEWMVDNDLTPHLVADARVEGLDVPSEHISDDRIVLNISFQATQELVLGNEEVTFEARFGGVPRHLKIPVAAVLGIYARETGQGMVFSEERTDPEPDPDPPEPGGDRPQRPKLKVVK